ncbi:hypothetical protein ILUMI_22706 [Ignelater luminosus]|uniref:Putative alpha-L-fucosidase n=1 Tax=Ignelater luminosus TaxID=2038154 RepID=A0A8K0CA50_IGNLU|nr:hypothetical protein ILUMI_22706 [Ignelater luminosus]
MNFIALTTNILVLNIFFVYGKKYEPNWDSLDKRPLPQWYDDAKIGIMMHWGVYSVPSAAGGEWFWGVWGHYGHPNSNSSQSKFMRNNYPPQFTYQDFARYFTAEFFNPDDWADLFENSGAKYITLTTKHHEGFTLWPSTYSPNWNAKDVGPNRDLVGELAKAVRSRNITFGTYYSLYEFYNPIEGKDKRNHHKTNEYIRRKMFPEMLELVEKYKTEIIWVDGDWEGKAEYWNSTGFLAWLYNESPVKDTVVVNDRWGLKLKGHHGDFWNLKDNFASVTLIKHKWEGTRTLDLWSWGYRRNMNLDSLVPTKDLIRLLVRDVSCGGNFVMNIGPTHDGRIDLVFQERLLDVGKWLKINGEAIYKTRYWTYQNDTVSQFVWYTKGQSAVYAIAIEWPKENVLQLGSANELFVNKKPIVTMLGYPDKLKWTITNTPNKTVSITFPNRATVKGEWAWALKIK